jgi:hypothetical protein
MCVLSFTSDIGAFTFPYFRGRENSKASLQDASIGQTKIEGVSVDHGAFSMSRDAGNSEGISAVAQHCARNHQGKPLSRCRRLGGSGGWHRPGKLPLRVIEVEGVGGVGAHAGLRGKIDRKRNSVRRSAVTVMGAPPRVAPCSGAQGRRRGWLAAARSAGIGDQILVAENQQQGGEGGRGKGRLKPGQPPLPLGPETVGGNGTGAGARRWSARATGLWPPSQMRLRREDRGRTRGNRRGAPRRPRAHQASAHPEDNAPRSSVVLLRCDPSPQPQCGPTYNSGRQPSNRFKPLRHSRPKPSDSRCASRTRS